MIETRRFLNPTMTVRPVTLADIPLLTEYWYDGMALRSQKQRTIRLMPDALTRWQQYAESLIDNSEVIFLAVELENELLGGIIGRVEKNQVGVLPEHYGLIEQVVIDLHSPHKRKNAVTELLEALKNDFRRRDISHIMVHASVNSPVEQGFWRGLGLRHLEDTFWMEL